MKKESKIYTNTLYNTQSLYKTMKKLIFNITEKPTYFSFLKADLLR